MNKMKYENETTLTPGCLTASGTGLTEVDPEDLLTAEESEELYRRWKEGESLKKLAGQTGYPMGLVSRVVAALRAGEIARLDLSYIPSNEFNEPLSDEAEYELLGPVPGTELPEVADLPAIDVASDALADIPAWFCKLQENDLLAPMQESHLFRKMNYLKFKASQLREALDADHPSMSIMGEIEKLFKQAVTVKNTIVQANLRLVVSIAKKHASSTVPLYDLISDGNLSLIKAVEKFDYSRGFKFSTYASWALLRNFSRTIPSERKHHQRFRSSEVDLFDMQPDSHGNACQQERVWNEQLNQVNRFMAELSPRERTILQLRFGLGSQAGKGQTLRQVGREIGVTKERVRQIETRALAKLRKLAQQECMELPECY
ncbi:MAG: sigma-70 family RNA polymerase sigma factor [Planctomycetia bacterium]|nr:sigma-70 family RNA polymerase sigma factor [Planctomycetia bacterium]